MGRIHYARMGFRPLCGQAGSTRETVIRIHVTCQKCQKIMRTKKWKEGQRRTLPPRGSLAQKARMRVLPRR